MKELYIGRTKGENDVVLEDTKVSRRHHCKCVLHDDGHITITDLNSTNGVFVDGKKISEETIVKKDTKIKIGNVDLTITDIKKWFNQDEQGSVTKCKEFKQKYENLAERYHNNLNELKKAIEINKEPYTQIFQSDDEKISYLVKEYTRKFQEAIDMMQLISKASRKDYITFRDDMDTIAEICKNTKGQQKEQCLEIRESIDDQVTNLQQETQKSISSSFQTFCGYYQSAFSSYYETTTSGCQLW